MGYLVCEECGGYYELQPGEKPKDFTSECECGGKTKYVENLEGAEKNMEEMEATITCPRCGTENHEDAKLCKSCKRLLRGVTPSISPKSDIKQSKEGVFEKWNEQSNLIKALSLIGICCVGLILIAGISGILSPDKNTSTVPTTTSTSQPTTASSSSSSGTVKVIATGQWQGSIMDSSGSKSVQGSGPQTFQLAQNPGNVIISFSKNMVPPSMNGTTKPDTSTLTIQIIDSNGKVVATQSTSAEGGNVAVSYLF